MPDNMDKSWSAYDLDEASRIVRTEQRRETIRRALAVVMILQGKAEEVKPDPDHDSDDHFSFERSPGIIPRVSKEVRSGSPIDGPVITKKTSIGEYFAAEYRNLTPAEVFDAGFLAGALASAEGNYDPIQLSEIMELISD